jgi:hypothetical protein
MSLQESLEFFKTEGKVEDPERLAEILANMDLQEQRQQQSRYDSQPDLVPSFSTASSGPPSNAHGESPPVAPFAGSDHPFDVMHGHPSVMGGGPFVGQPAPGFHNGNPLTWPLLPSVNANVRGPTPPQQSLPPNANANSQCYNYYHPSQIQQYDRGFDYNYSPSPSPSQHFGEGYHYYSPRNNFYSPHGPEFGQGSHYGASPAPHFHQGYPYDTSNGFSSRSASTKQFQHYNPNAFAQQRDPIRPHAGTTPTAGQVGMAITQQFQPNLPHRLERMRYDNQDDSFSGSGGFGSILL